VKINELPCRSPLRVKLRGEETLVPATFHRMDGSYGKCTLDNEPDTQDRMFYLYGHEDVELVDGRYQLLPEKKADQLNDCAGHTMTCDSWNAGAPCDCRP